MRNVLQHWLLLLTQRGPVVAVHVWHIEKDAISPPHFVKDLVPLISGNAIDKQTGRRDWFSGFVTLRHCVVKVVAWSLRHQEFRPIFGHHVAADIFSDRGLLAILESKDLQVRRTITRSTVEKSRSHGVDHVTRLRA